MDLASSGSLARILQHFHSESSRWPRARAGGGWYEIHGRWDRANREECLMGVWGLVFVGVVVVQVLVGMPSFQELPRVSMERYGPDQ